MALDIQQLFEEHHGALFRFLARLTGDPELAKDAVQETFLRLLRRPPRDQSHVRAWLFTVATNVARDITRSRNRRFRLLSASPQRAPVADPAPAPDEAVETTEARQLVRMALESLSEKERTILLMREEGFTHRDIAAVVGTTTKSVGTLVVRAMAKVTRRLRQNAPTP